MSTLSLRLPNSIHRHAKRLAVEEGVSINQLISAAVAEKISALDTERYLAERAARGRVTKFRRVLAKVPSAQPEAGDELDRP
ncbi:MAG: toxin-antitoxin system HicB family antitoxin [Verrucomicrobia bacterium]|nr:toxin-antitoxin system HicB family antitoxin [Verrucomicrobiota bacterium]